VRPPPPPARGADESGQPESFLTVGSGAAALGGLLDDRRIDGAAIQMKDELEILLPAWGTDVQRQDRRVLIQLNLVVGRLLDEDILGVSPGDERVGERERISLRALVFNRKGENAITDDFKRRRYGDINEYSLISEQRRYIVFQSDKIVAGAEGRGHSFLLFVVIVVSVDFTS